MADDKKKSQAEKAVQSSHSKTKTNTSAKTKNTGKDSGKDQSKNAPAAPALPVRFVTSVVCLFLFILFLVMFLKPEGALVTFFLNIIVGIIGKVGFYVSIPCLLYLFVIHAFSAKKPIVLRSICLISFILLCGCIFQLSLPSADYPDGFALLDALYTGAAGGATAGLLCGGFALIL